MEGTYPVTFGKRSLGKVQVLRQGLYYRFICRCQISSETIFRLVVTCADAMESLGVVVPMDGGFGLDTRLPVKRFSPGEPVFTLVPKLELGGSRFFPIYPDEPFSHIARLKEGYLSYQEGQAGIILRET